VLLLVIKLLGWSIAHAPEPLLRCVAAVLGDLIFFAMPRRRRLVLSNLHHAFPEKSESWRRSIGRESCHRMIETVLLSLATPYLTESRLRGMVFASPELLACYAEHRNQPRATLFCSPHLAYWEAQTSMSLIVPGPFPEFGTIYRPLDNAAADAFVKGSRERYGMRLLSRREGFAEALKILRRRGFVGVLFDQNAGMQGALTLLFDRVCSTSELPGLMAEKFDAAVYGIFPRRRAFWRVEIGLDRIENKGTGEDVTLAVNTGSSGFSALTTTSARPGSGSMIAGGTRICRQSASGSNPSDTCSRPTCRHAVCPHHPGAPGFGSACPTGSVMSPWRCRS
jgi:lauroyl/myristoyl acyltransferase